MIFLVMGLFIGIATIVTLLSMRQYRHGAEKREPFPLLWRGLHGRRQLQDSRA
jgi:hypothetical protein